MFNLCIQPRNRIINFILPFLGLGPAPASNLQAGWPNLVFRRLGPNLIKIVVFYKEKYKEFAAANFGSSTGRQNPAEIKLVTSNKISNLDC